MSRTVWYRNLLSSLIGVLIFEEQSPQEASTNRYYFLNLPPQDQRRFSLLLSTMTRAILKICMLKSLPLVCGTLLSGVSENRPGNPFGCFAVASTFDMKHSKSEQHSWVHSRKVKFCLTDYCCALLDGKLSVCKYWWFRTASVCTCVREGGFCCRFCSGCFSYVVYSLIPQFDRFEFP